MNMPIIRLEIEHLKHCVLHAFSDYQLNFDEDVKAAVEKFCEPSNIKLIVDRAVDTAMKEMIEREVRQYFEFGDGREVIHDLVKNKLSKKRKKV